MSEQQLLTRARDLANLEELAEDVTAILGSARASRVDPDALTRLAGAAMALGETSTGVYNASGQPFTDDRGYLDAVEEAESDIEMQLALVLDTQREVRDARRDARRDLTAGRRDLGRARNMGTSNPCDGCHDAKAAAIAAAEEKIRDALERISVCDEASRVLDHTTSLLRHALKLIRSVPEDLEETYEAVYEFLDRQAGRDKGVLPKDGDFLTGEGM